MSSSVRHPPSAVGDAWAQSSRAGSETPGETVAGDTDALVDADAGGPALARRGVTPGIVSSPQRRKDPRSPATRERLGRLRTELAKIKGPADPEQARQEILEALARAGLGAWTLPEFSDPDTQKCDDGSLRLQLLAHAIFFNPWGAFRIVDLHAGSSASTTYFERAGEGSREFKLPLLKTTPCSGADDTDRSPGRPR